MVLAERVFVSLVVFVQDGAVRGDAEVGQREGRDRFAPAAVQADFIDLGLAWEGGAGRVRQDVGAVEERPVGQGGQGCLGPLPGSELQGRTAGGRHDPDVLAAFAVGAEYEAFAVCAPDRIGLVCRGSRNLSGLAAGGADGEDVALIGECDGLSVGGDGAVAEPAGGILGICGCGEQRQGCKGRYKVFIHANFFIIIQ